MRVMLLCLLLLASTPILTGFSVYHNLADWQSAVGSHQLEDFDDVPTQGIPDEGGSIFLDDFAIVADGNHGTNYKPCTLCAPFVGDGRFVGDVHSTPGEVSFNDFDFYQPITAFALEFFDVEDAESSIGFFGDEFSVFVIPDDTDEVVRTFVGIVFDAPITKISFSADYQSFSVDDVRWVTAIPEPSTLLLVLAGLIGVAAQRRVHA